jgi:hypothetical protein
MSAREVRRTASLIVTNANYLSAAPDEHAMRTELAATTQRGGRRNVICITEQPEKNKARIVK